MACCAPSIVLALWDREDRLLKWYGTLLFKKSVKKVIVYFPVGPFYIFLFTDVLGFSVCPSPQEAGAPTVSKWANPRSQTRPAWFLWHHSVCVCVHAWMSFNLRNSWVPLCWLVNSCFPHESHTHNQSVLQPGFRVGRLTLIPRYFHYLFSPSFDKFKIQRKLWILEACVLLSPWINNC